MSEARVIDVDGHVFEPESVWEEYLDSAFQSRRPRIVRDNRNTTRYMLEGRLIPPGEGRGAWAPEGIVEATTHRDGAFDENCAAAAQCESFAGPSDFREESGDFRKVQPAREEGSEAAFIE